MGPRWECTPHNYRWKKSNDISPSSDNRNNYFPAPFVRYNCNYQNVATAHEAVEYPDEDDDDGMGQMKIKNSQLELMILQMQLNSFILLGFSSASLATALPLRELVRYPIPTPPP